MSQLLVRNLDPGLVKALQRRAAAHGRSAEAEHREILRLALAPDAEADAFKRWLMSMPNVGDDADFERVRELPRDVEL
jgi:plasmid stability protein